MSQKTWGGRFEGDTDDRVEAFTESISFDRRLYRHDIRASQAHARMLAEVGLLTTAEAEQICTALDEIGAEIEAGKIEFSIALEDIHTHIERALIAKLGDVGRKLHTGRSRNDQVVTDVKLWVRDAIDELDRLARGAAEGVRRRRPSASATSSCRLHAPAAGPAGARGPLLPGLRREVPARPRAARRLPQARQRAAARRRGARRHVAADRPRIGAPATRLRLGRAATVSTSPAIATSCSSSSSTCR